MDVHKGTEVTVKEKKELLKKANELDAKTNANKRKQDILVFDIPKDAFNGPWGERIPNIPGKYFAGYKELKNGKFRLALK